MSDGWEDFEYYDAREIIPSVFPKAKVTSTSRDENHPLSRKNPNSKHINNPNAFDVAPIPGVSYGQFLNGLKQAGYEVSQPIDEQKNPSRHATGAHWHGVITKGPKKEDIGVNSSSSNEWVDVDPKDILEDAPESPVSPAEGVDDIPATPTTLDTSDPLAVSLAAEQSKPGYDPASKDSANLSGKGNVFEDEKWGFSPETRKAMGLNEDGSFDASNPLLPYLLEQGFKAGIQLPEALIESIPGGGALLEAFPAGMDDIIPAIGNRLGKVDTPDEGGLYGAIDATGAHRDLTPEEIARYDSVPEEIPVNRVDEPVAITVDTPVVPDVVPEVKVDAPDRPAPAMAMEVDPEVNAVDAHPGPNATQEELTEYSRRLNEQDQQGGGNPPPNDPPPTGGDGNGEPPKDPSEDVLIRLTGALKGAKRLNEKQRKLYTEARSEKLKRVGTARATTEGEEGLHAELGALKGELPKVDFEGVRDQFSQDEVDSLFNRVKNEKKLSWFNAVNARVGLAKLLDGQLPTKSEIALLEKTFPKDFIDAALGNRSLKQKLVDGAGNALNLPRALMSSFDLSAPFRQGAFLVSRPQFWQALPSMFKSFGSEKAYQGMMESIYSKSTYPLMDESGLSLTEIGQSLTAREEAFMSGWAEKMPGNNIASKSWNNTIGRGVKASDRAYSGFLNKVRADTFDSIYHTMKDSGVNFNDSPEILPALAKYINNATGRGNIPGGELVQSATPLFNALLFSPKLMSSRLNLMNPKMYIDLPAPVRKEAIRDLLGFGAITASVIGLAKMGGAEVEGDMRSSDFAKIKKGDTRYDVLAGFQQYARMGAQLVTNERKTLKGNVQELGKGYGTPSRLDQLATFFFRQKGSPVATFIYDYLDGKNIVGEPFEVRKAITDRFIPLFIKDVADAYDDRGIEGAVEFAPGMFGVGVQNFEQKKSDEDKIKDDDDGWQDVATTDAEWKDFDNWETVK